ncbi:MAG TPA: peptide ABC transporter substrate-binding protein [Opitutaceae bacterium]|nr:peptide ABC transporter substrate-binding protein [Opitutaceae bacterium]
MRCERLPPLLCLLSAVFLWAGCGKRETPAAEGVRTKTLLLGNGAEPADLDPHVVTAYTDQNILIALFEGLTAFDEKTSQPVPAAAERWENSPDGLTWTFHLRAGLKWSNGEPLTADDFAQSWRRALLPAIACPNADLLLVVKNAGAFNAGKLTDPAALGFTAPDARTVVITLERPTAILPLLTALPVWFPINPRALSEVDALAKRSGAWTRPGKLVGNGPFALTEWSPDSRLIVSKNPHYWDAARCQLERVIFFPIENAEVEERNFRAGQLHVTYALPSSKIATYREGTATPFRADPLLQTLYVNFNTTKAPFGDPKVRRALALAIDREAIARAVFSGSQRAAFHFTPPDCGGYTARERLAFDPETARRLLAEAGFPGGKDLPSFPLQVLNDSNSPRMAEALQATWLKELGVRITIEPYEQKTWLQNQQSMTHTAGVLRWTADFADPVTFLGLFASNGGNNWTGWKNPEYDRLLAQAADTVDPRTRHEIFQAAEKLLLTEAPIAPLVFGGKSYLAHPAVKGWEPAPVGFHRYQYVSLKN